MACQDKLVRNVGRHQPLLGSTHATVGQWHCSPPWWQGSPGFRLRGVSGLQWSRVNLNSCGKKSDLKEAGEWEWKASREGPCRPVSVLWDTACYWLDGGSYWAMGYIQPRKPPRHPKGAAAVGVQQWAPQAGFPETLRSLSCMLDGLPGAWKKLVFRLKNYAKSEPFIFQ